MNPRELVARLNAAAMNMEGARGGIPEYTPQDIAAALGMIPDSFPRECFCAIWWPDGAKLVRKQLDAYIAAAQFDAWKDRADELVTAQIAVAQAANDWRAYDLAKAKQALARAREEMWPSLAEEPYALIRAAVIAELRSHRMCSTCNGRGEVKNGDLVVICENCGATGRAAVSDVQRALMLKRNESSYRRTWRSVYEWTYRLVSDAEKEGRDALSGALTEPENMSSA